jgi:hypothetical protein
MSSSSNSSSNSIALHSGSLFLQDTTRSQSQGLPCTLHRHLYEIYHNLDNDQSDVSITKKENTWKLYYVCNTTVNECILSTEDVYEDFDCVHLLREGFGLRLIHPDKTENPYVEMIFDSELELKMFCLAVYGLTRSESMKMYCLVIGWGDEISHLQATGGDGSRAACSGDNNTSAGVSGSVGGFISGSASSSSSSSSSYKNNSSSSNGNKSGLPSSPGMDTVPVPVLDSVDRLSFLTVDVDMIPRPSFSPHCLTTASPHTHTHATAVLSRHNSHDTSQSQSHNNDYDGDGEGSIQDMNGSCNYSNMLFNESCMMLVVSPLPLPSPLSVSNDSDVSSVNESSLLSDYKDFTKHLCQVHHDGCIAFTEIKERSVDVDTNSNTTIKTQDNKSVAAYKCTKFICSEFNQNTVSKEVQRATNLLLPYFLDSEVVIINIEIHEESRDNQSGRIMNAFM